MAACSDCGRAFEGGACPHCRRSRLLVPVVVGGFLAAMVGAGALAYPKLRPPPPVALETSLPVEPGETPGVIETPAGVETPETPLATEDPLATETPPATETPSAAEERQGTASGLDPARLDPNDASAAITALIFEGLTRFTPDSKEVQPGLAESWEWSPDGLTLTLHLRQGVKFHDGTALEAEAVRASFTRQLDSGDFPRWTELWGDHLRGVEALDPATVRLTLTEMGLPVLDNLADPCCFIISPQSSAEHPVGTGPYRLASWQDGQIELEAFPDYLGAAPNPERVIYRL